MDPMRKILEAAARTDGSRSPSALGVDEFFVNRAIDLAWRGAGRVQPNPLVGAVVVRDGAVLGEGFHAACGLDHAETVALDRAGNAEGATLYVTLEPCTHEGKTPPCIGRIIDSRVGRVVIATLDPDTRMNGAGVAALRDAGMEVMVGCGAGRALLLNLGYLKKKLEMGPAVTLKMATTLDGRIASMVDTEDAISGCAARRMVHRLRANHDAVLVGIGTLMVDRPRLDCRLLDSVAEPTPVVVDTGLRFPADYRWLEEGRRCVLLTAGELDGRKVSDIEAKGGEVVRCRSKSGRVDLADGIRRLYESGIHSVLVEGGGEVFTDIVESRLWDVMHVIVSPLTFGTEGVPLTGHMIKRSEIDGALVGSRPVDDDVVIDMVSNRTIDALLGRLI